MLPNFSLKQIHFHSNHWYHWSKYTFNILFSSLAVFITLLYSQLSYEKRGLEVNKQLKICTYKSLVFFLFLPLPECNTTEFEIINKELVFFPKETLLIYCVFRVGLNCNLQHFKQWVFGECVLKRIKEKTLCHCSIKLTEIRSFKAFF